MNSSLEQQLFADGRRVGHYRDHEAPESVGPEVAPASGDSCEPESPAQDAAPESAEAVSSAGGEAGVSEGVASADGASTVYPALQGQIVGSELVVSAEPAEPAKDPAWRKLLRRLGLGSAPPDPDEMASEDFERIIRQATWTRAVNVAVLSTAGGDGVTPTALMLGNTLAWVRGGGVAVVEGTIAPGALSRLAEGTPRRGLAEMLEAASRIGSAGAVAGYSAPQTAHSDIFGSIGVRDQLADKDVLVARELLDTYYKVSVTDADHNVWADTTRTVIASADSVVIPCVRHPQSLHEAWRTFEAVAQQRPDLADGSGETVPRVVFVLGSDGPGEDLSWVEGAAGWLHTRLQETSRGGPLPALVQEVPFEPVMKSGQEITHAACTRASLNAWKRVTAGVVLGLLDAPEAPTTPLTATATTETAAPEKR